MFTGTVPYVSGSSLELFMNTTLIYSGSNIDPFNSGPLWSISVFLLGLGVLVSRLRGRWGSGEFPETSVVKLDFV